MPDHVDLYQQMLWDAQRVEDTRLARMLQDRLRHSTDRPEKSGGNIVPFPGGGAALYLETEPAMFWKQHDFWRDLGQMFMVMVIVGAWFFMPFIKIILTTPG